MTITLDLTPIEEAQLVAAAQQKGVAPELFVRKLVTERLPHGAELTFAEILAPLNEDFQATGMTDEELGEFIDAEIKAYRAEKRLKVPSAHE